MAKENFSHEELLDLMGASEPESWYQPTAEARKHGATIENEPGDFLEGTTHVTPQYVTAYGNALMRDRRPRGEDTAHHPNRRVDRGSFGM